MLGSDFRWGQPAEADDFKATPEATPEANIQVGFGCIPRKKDAKKDARQKVLKFVANIYKLMICTAS